LSVVAEAYGHICEALDKHPTLSVFLTDQVVEWGRITIERLEADRWLPRLRMRLRRTLRVSVSRACRRTARCRPHGPSRRFLLRSPRSVSLSNCRPNRARTRHQLIVRYSHPVNRLYPPSKLVNFAVLPLPLGDPSLPSRSLSLPEKAMVVVAIYNSRYAGRDPIDPWRDHPPESRLLKSVQILIQAQSYDQNGDEFGLSEHLSTIQRYVKEVRAACSVAESSPTTETAKQQRDVVTSPQTVQPVDSEPEKITTTVRSDRTASGNEVNTPQTNFSLDINPSQTDDDCDTSKSKDPHEDFKDSQGEWLTADFCKKRFGLNSKSLSRWAVGDSGCVHLADRRPLRRKKIALDPSKPKQQVWCFHRLDIETIVDARDPDE
jgi:hypothetical protein